MKSNYGALISLGALVALAGFILSGPASFLLVQWLKPQPPWVSPKVFAMNYSPLQDLPYYFGLLLIGGMLMLAAGHYLNYNEEKAQVKFHLLLSVVWSTIFAALIFFNYICQTTFIRHLALDYKPENDFAIATFSMANPHSFCWTNEMWGYGILGVATWLMAGYYSDKNSLIQWLLIANGVISIAGVIGTIISTSWLTTPTGLVAYTIWNLLMIVLVARIYFFSRKTLQS